MEIFNWNDIKDSLFSSNLIAGFENGSGISIGSFDGLHQGHRLLISTLVEHCKSMGIKSGVVSFTRPLPSYKHAEDYQGDLTTLNQRLKLFTEAGLDFAIIVDFTKDFSELKGVEFLQLLVNSFNMKFIAEGVDFRCGYKGSTDISAIKYFADQSLVKYEFVEPVYYRPGTDEEERISSSYIRNMVLKRFLSTAEELLERPYSLELEFNSDQMKIPLTEIKQAVPPSGVYQAKINGQSVRVEITDTDLTVSGTDAAFKPILNENIEVVL